VIKASLLIMVVLTVLISMGLRWREQRMPAVAKQRRIGLLARGKKGLDRWVTAAMIAVVVTLVVLGGLHWLNVWVG
jgi:TRAP-type mannitol/chloroaromatic compound transport system permease small subunit